MILYHPTWVLVNWVPATTSLICRFHNQADHKHRALKILRRIPTPQKRAVIKYIHSSEKSNRMEFEIEQRDFCKDAPHRTRTIGTAQKTVQRSSETRITSKISCQKLFQQASFSQRTIRMYQIVDSFVNFDYFSFEQLFVSSFVPISISYGLVNLEDFSSGRRFKELL